MGGDAYTVDIELNHQIYAVDAGFEFLNAQGFPKFYKLLDMLGVKRTNFQLTASFSSSSKKSFVITPISDEGLSIGSILKPGNLLKLIRLKQFFDKARKAIDIQSEGGIKKEYKTIGQFLDEVEINKNFREDFLLPMLASGWGISSDEILDWSMENVLRTVLSEPDGIAAPIWCEIDGGTRSYISAAQSKLENTKVIFNSDISSILYHEKSETYEIVRKSGSDFFDELIIATPAHQVFTLLKNIDQPQIVKVRDSLDKVEYYESRILLHGDSSFMPKKRHHWSVVNVRQNGLGTQTGMTMYKKWHTPIEKPIFKSWFLEGDKIPNPLYAEVKFLHRKLDRNYVNAKAAVQSIQGKHHLWFIGTHTLGDRHENAVISAMKVAEKLAPNSSRLKSLK